MTPIPPDPPKKTRAEREADERKAIAKGLKADGYNSAVVARKMITLHGMAEADAEELVGSLYNKKVNARAGDTASAIVGGVGMAVAGATALGVMLYTVGFAFGYVILIYAALVGVIGKGFTQALFAVVNSNVKEDLVKKD